MGSQRVYRAAASAAVALAGLVLALLAGAPPAAALLALFAGIAAVMLAAPVLDADPEGEEAAPNPPASEQPDPAEFLSAIDQPLLLVRNRRVVAANSAARRLLGDHVEGVDVRLAIRHPAAAEPLLERQPDPESRIIRTDLAGLGERDSRWEMTASLLADGSRLVHLQDRSDSDASERMRTDFVANASHELRTPLATLLGFLETLQEDDAAEDKKTRSRFIRIMFDEAQRMHRLVDDLISLSRIEAERFSLPRESVPLLPLVEEVRASCVALIEEKGSSVETELAGLEPVASGDRAQLLQLIQNLVVNALKYGRSNTSVRIRFAEADGDMLRMSVIDQGEGIAPEHLPRLTERFYRADPSRSRSMGGTGLGLAIVKHIIGRHRGRLDIRSKVGEGTAVHVYLPRAPVPLSSKSHLDVTEVTRTDVSDMTNPDAGLDGG